MFEEARGLEDDAIVRKAYEEDWILVTNDKDFGEKVFREHYPHKGIVLLRLEDERSSVKIETLKQLLANYSERLADNFVVVTEERVRFGRKG